MPAPSAVENVKHITYGVTQVARTGLTARSMADSVAGLTPAEAAEQLHHIADRILRPPKLSVITAANLFADGVVLADWADLAVAGGALQVIRTRGGVRISGPGGGEVRCTMPAWAELIAAAKDGDYDMTPPGQ